MKISEWLANLDSHDIYDATKLGKDFAEKTGFKPCWPVSTPSEIRKAIKDRGVGGFINAKSEKQVMASGYEVAQALERKFVPPLQQRSGMYMGRGKIFRAAIEALQAVGK